jgi:hypothetical protein
MSYAAAWQLGRLLALKNQEFAAALFSWKLANKRETIESAERALLGARVSGDEAAKAPAAGSVAKAALDVVRSGLSSLAASPSEPKP